MNTRIRSTVPLLAFFVSAFDLTYAADPQSSQATISRNEEPKRNPRLAPIDKFLFDATGKLQMQIFGATDRKACEALLRGAPEKKRGALLLILAQNQRIMEKEPRKALYMLVRLALPKDVFESWNTADTAAQKQALALWKEEDRARAGSQARTPTPAGPFSPLPPIPEWGVTNDSIVFVLEIVRCLIDLGKLQDAFAIIDNLGKDFQDERRVLTAECAGELMVKMQLYEKGLAFFKFALHALEALKSSEYTENQKLLQRRVSQKMAEAQWLWECEQYGEGWVRYRDAEEKRRKENDFLDAFLLYAHIRQYFDKTVYAEAATCYSIKCLLALASDEGQKKAKETLRQAEIGQREQSRRLALAKQAGVPPSALSDFAKKAEDTTKRLVTLRTVPLGPSAATAATKLAAEFLSANEWGLFRGETLADIGEYDLEHNFDAAKAEQQLNRAFLWFTKVGEMDAAVTAFDVPDKARQVSAPPPSMKLVDAFGNIRWADSSIGAIVNHRTCAWYTPYFQMQTGTKRSLCQFILGNKEAAIAGLDIILSTDVHEKRLVENKMPNSYFRLKSEFNQDRMFATKTDLKHFKEPVRTKIIIADYYYEIEKWPEALHRYRQIDVQSGRELDETARAYLDLALGYSSGAIGLAEESLSHFMKFETLYENTPSWPRAMFHLFAHYQNEVQTHPKALVCLQRIQDKMPRTAFGRDAHIFKGIFFFSFGEVNRAKTIFEECIDKYPTTTTERCAKQYLAMIDAKATKGGSE
ncbi:secreted protein [sediment metagenome]|uniref:Secreted protein n=1 Tax=sediment metagenome TaxID=749907 RepID=D9PKT9_9ZZZZ